MEAGTFTPDRTMATVPAERLDLTHLLCFEKKLTEVPGAAASLAPPTFFSTKMGVLVTFLATAFFLANL